MINAEEAKILLAWAECNRQADKDEKTGIERQWKNIIRKLKRIAKRE